MAGCTESSQPRDVLFILLISQFFILNNKRIILCNFKILQDIIFLIYIAIEYKIFVFNNYQNIFVISDAILLYIQNEHFKYFKQFFNNQQFLVGQLVDKFGTRVGLFPLLFCCLRITYYMSPRNHRELTFNSGTSITQF